MGQGGAAMTRESTFGARLRALMEERGLSYGQLGALLGRNPQTLHRWVKEGSLQAVQVGRNQLCSKEELLAFLATPERVLGCRELVGEFLAETQ